MYEGCDLLLPPLGSLVHTELDRIYCILIVRFTQGIETNSLMKDINQK